MKTHSREWFLQQVADTRKGISESWPNWMKEGRTVATASFPRVGDDKKKDQGTLIGGSDQAKQK
jgi:hypothetical protein